MKLSAIASVLFFSLIASFSQASDPIYTPLFNNLAIKGYDSVAYFTENEAIKGSKNHEFDWKGATWRFSSQENLELFKSDPEKYSPQYGGYCAYAVAQNKLASIDPSQFSVVDGKLYLNYNKKVQEKWLQDRDGYIATAEENWPDILSN